MKIWLAAFLSALSFSQAQAAVTCQGMTNMGEVSVRIEKDRAVVWGGALSRPLVIMNLANQWDGHMTGLMTAPGFAMKYENHYGCIRNAVIFTPVRDNPVGYIGTLKVATCRGGTTSDSLCLRK